MNVRLRMLLLASLVRRAAVRVMAGALLMVAGAFLLPAPVSDAAPASARECECVDYVREAWDLWDSLPGKGEAYRMAHNDWFKNQGFRQTKQPEQWAAIVTEPGWGGLDDGGAGHVALVKDAVRRPDGWKMTVRGANQHYSNYTKDGKFVFWEEYGCWNVSDATWKAIVTWEDLATNRVTMWMPIEPRW